MLPSVRDVSVRLFHMIYRTIEVPVIRVGNGGSGNVCVFRVVVICAYHFWIIRYDYLNSVRLGYIVR